MLNLRGRALSALVLATVGMGVAACAPTTDPAAAACAQLSSSVYEAIDPRNQSDYLTTSPSEASTFAQRGYSYSEEYLPTWKAATAPATGLVAVHRLYRAKNHDYLLSADAQEMAEQVRTNDYVDQGPAFYAAAQPSSCSVPIHRYAFRGQHRLVTEKAATRLEQSGWRDEGVKFHATPTEFSGSPGTSAAPGTETVESGSAGPTSFTFAVMPDTQLEVVREADRRMQDRSVWLVENQKRLNLAFVVHTGDIVDTDTKPQFARAQRGLGPLRAAGIPFTVAVGNRDTPVKCSDSGTCRDATNRAAVRNTSDENRYLGKDFTALQGEYEKGKLDNGYVVYKAAGRTWMVLTLELWPRPEVVQWANKVVASHPQANVIVATHSYLTASGGIQQTHGGYGSTSPQYLFDNLIKRHGNIEIVLSGHTGGYAHRVDTGVHGNKIYSFLQAIHDPDRNPVRLVQIDTTKQTLQTWIYASDGNATYPGSQVSIAGLRLTK